MLLNLCLKGGMLKWIIQYFYTWRWLYYSRIFISPFFSLSSFIPTFVPNAFLSRHVFSFLSFLQFSSSMFLIFYSLISSLIYICVIFMYHTYIFPPNSDYLIFFHLQFSENSEIVSSNFSQFLVCSMWIMLNEWMLMI